MKQDGLCAALVRLAAFAFAVLMTVGAGVGAAHAAQVFPDEALARADQIEATPPEPSAAVFANGKHEGLIEGSHIDFEFRNYTDYLHMAGGTTRHAWVGGMQARFESGFTSGLVGLGADAALFGALKFDGGAGVGNMVHVGRNGGGSNQLAWAYPGTYDVKARLSETVLKYGLHAVSNPFLEPHDNRALPPTFLGASMLSQEWKQLALQAGSFTKVNARGHTVLSGLSTSYGGVPVRLFSFVGGTWTYSPNGNAMLYAGQADDVWRQYYASIQHGIGRIEALRLTGAAGVYVTQDTGAARQGAIDNRAYGLSLSAQHGPHSLLVGYQKISSDQFFDYVNETAGDYLVNSMDVDYNAPHEQSLQLRYSFDGKYATLPGFSAMVWAQQGWGADAAAGAQRYGSGGPGAPVYGAVYLKNGQAVHGRHHEFGITPSYVVQSGRFKQTKVALIAMWHVGSAYYSDPTSQVYRLVVTLPARLL